MPSSTGTCQRCCPMKSGTLARRLFDREITALRLFVFIIVQAAQVFIVVELVVFIFVDVDVLDLVIKLFVDIFLILVVKIFVVEVFVVLLVVEVFVFEVVLVFEFLVLDLFLFIAGMSPEQRRRGIRPGISDRARRQSGSANRASNSRQSSMDSVLSPREFIGQFPLTNALSMADSLLG